MTHFIVLVLALLIGAVAGGRPFVAPAVMAWAAALHWVNLDGTWVQWLSHPASVVVWTLLAIGECVIDRVPGTALRTAPVQFIARIALGGFAGAVLGTAWNYTWTSLGAAMIGAVIGVLVSLGIRQRLVKANEGHELAVGLFEDAVAVLGGLAVAALTAVV